MGGSFWVAFGGEFLTAARSLTLAMPYIIGSIGEKAMYVFGACNVIAIPIGE